MLATSVPSAATDPGRLLSVSAVPGESPGLVVIEVIGEVDTYTAPLLQLCLDSQVTQHGLRELIVDLDQVTFLGAAGVTVLARADRRCRMRGARLVLRCAGMGAIDPGDSGRPLHRSERTSARPRPTPRRPARERLRRGCR